MLKTLNFLFSNQDLWCGHSLQWSRITNECNTICVREHRQHIGKYAFLLPVPCCLPMNVTDQRYCKKSKMHNTARKTLSYVSKDRKSSTTIRKKIEFLERNIKFLAGNIEFLQSVVVIMFVLFVPADRNIATLRP